jgi:uncharacterized membrane protein
MAEDNPDRHTVNDYLTSEDVERIARRIADERQAELLARLGIEPEDVPKWRSFFAEVKPIDAREAVAAVRSQKETWAAMSKTMRSKVLDWIVMGFLVAALSGAVSWVKKP